MRYRTLALTVAVATAATCLTAAACSAPANAAASGVRITAIYFDPPGSDSNYPYNVEWVRIKNVGAAGASLTHWGLWDAAGHHYPFPSFSLAGGATVRVHTGRNHNTATDLYWGHQEWIWNNDGDTATLCHATGGTVDTCSYSSVAAPEATC